jgi:Flp pilus assembly protein protease CpaA
MEEYIFLFALGLVWSIFAVVQDLRTREVANWLNFSLITFAIAYRAFYWAFTGDVGFFLSGVGGFGLFYILANVFYYGRAFAGGDAKLLMGFGVILPYGNFGELVYLSIIFIFALFFVGSIWSLIFSVYVVKNNWNKFRKEFHKGFRKVREIFVIVLVALGAVLLLGIFDFIYWTIIWYCTLI